MAVLGIWSNSTFDAFANEIDYAELVKIYSNDPEGQKRYSAAQCRGAVKQAIPGDPEQAHTSTPFVESQSEAPSPRNEGCRPQGAKQEV
jgi:hypothetical protein